MLKIDSILNPLCIFPRGSSAATLLSFRSRSISKASFHDLSPNPESGLHFRFPSQRSRADKLQKFQPLDKTGEILGALHVYADEARQGITQVADAKRYCFLVRKGL